MKQSTQIHAIAAALTTFGLASAGVALLSGNPTGAGAIALVAAAGQALDAYAHVIEKPGNGA